MLRISMANGINSTCSCHTQNFQPTKGSMYPATARASMFPSQPTCYRLPVHFPCSLKSLPQSSLNATWVGVGLGGAGDSYLHRELLNRHSSFHFLFPYPNITPINTLPIKPTPKWGSVCPALLPRPCLTCWRLSERGRFVKDFKIGDCCTFF